MTDIEERQADQDPEPLKHSDAERVGSENADDSEAAEELEDDPSRNPQEKELGDVKGG